jgi:hypothetical protein
MAGVGKSHAEDSDDEPESLQYKVIILGDGEIVKEYKSGPNIQNKLQNCKLQRYQ